MLRSLVGLKREQEGTRVGSAVSAIKLRNAETQAEFATLLVKAGFHDEALRILNKALQTSRSFPVVYALGIVKLSVKDYREAEEYLNSALTLKPDDVATLRALARVARVTGNFEKSAFSSSKGAPHCSGFCRGPLRLRCTALQMGLILDALPVFERLQRDYPREPTYLYALAAAHWTKGDVAETTRLMNTYVALQPRAPLGWYLLGAALLRQEKPSEAKVAIERSLSLKVDANSEYLLGVISRKPATVSLLQRDFERPFSCGPTTRRAMRPSEPPIAKPVTMLKLVWNSNGPLNLTRMIFARIISWAWSTQN
jgi:predicted Zn-dependent protease